MASLALRHEIKRRTRMKFALRAPDLFARRRGRRRGKPWAMGIGCISASGGIFLPLILPLMAGEKPGGGIGARGSSHMLRAGTARCGTVTKRAANGSPDIAAEARLGYYGFSLRGRAGLAMAQSGSGRGSPR